MRGRKRGRLFVLPWEAGGRKVRLDVSALSILARIDNARMCADGRIIILRVLRDGVC